MGYNASVSYVACLLKYAEVVVYDHIVTCLCRQLWVLNTQLLHDD